MALGMGGYGSYGYGASYVPVPVHPGYGGSGGVGDGGICKLISSIKSFKKHILLFNMYKNKPKYRRTCKNIYKNRVFVYKMV